MDEVVGDEHQRLAGLGVLEANTPQMFGAISAAVVAVQRYGLVAEDAGRVIRRRRVDASEHPCPTWRTTFRRAKST